MTAAYLVEADDPDDYDVPLRQVALYSSLVSAQASIPDAEWTGPAEEDGRRYWSNIKLDTPRCFITEFEVL